MELERAERALRQMRKLLSSLPDDPAPNQVHMLRTRARRIEAVAAAFEPVDGKAAKQLLKAIKPVRKAAGGVRDMDVLTEDLLGMPQDGMNGSLVRLVDHLERMRQQSAGELMDAVSRQRKAARRQLKKFVRTVESVGNGKKQTRTKFARALASKDGNGSLASDLIEELSRWPSLNAENIHPFRLKVKVLRYVLQLFRDADEQLITALGKVKDKIGDWHDWQQLGEIAHKLLDSDTDKLLLQKIQSAEKRKFSRAIASAESLRTSYLHTNGNHRKAL
jgi:CHAD domain-containing protein